MLLKNSFISLFSFLFLFSICLFSSFSFFILNIAVSTVAMPIMGLIGIIVGIINLLVLFLIFLGDCINLAKAGYCIGLGYLVLIVSMILIIAGAIVNFVIKPKTV